MPGQSQILEKHNPMSSQLIKRLNHNRVKKLKNIDNENMKIFQNLSRIKSSISKQNFNKHEQTSNIIKSLITKDRGGRLDPLISLDRTRQGMSKRSITPFFKLTQNQIHNQTSNILLDKKLSSGSFNQEVERI